MNLDVQTWPTCRNKPCQKEIHLMVREVPELGNLRFKYMYTVHKPRLWMVLSVCPVKLFNCFCVLFLSGFWSHCQILQSHCHSTSEVWESLAEPVEVWHWKCMQWPESLTSSLSSWNKTTCCQCWWKVRH